MVDFVRVLPDGRRIPTDVTQFTGGAGMPDAAARMVVPQRAPSVRATAAPPKLAAPRKPSPMPAAAAPKRRPAKSSRKPAPAPSPSPSALPQRFAAVRSLEDLETLVVRSPESAACLSALPARPLGELVQRLMGDPEVQRSFGKDRVALARYLHALGLGVIPAPRR